MHLTQLVPSHSSLARRPIYPGRRSKRYSATCRYDQREVPSDEGNTSEYSVSPSSKSSTLESNPGERSRSSPIVPRVHTTGTRNSPIHSRGLPSSARCSPIHGRGLPNSSMKRPPDDTSDTSDSESEDNTLATVVAQLGCNVHSIT